MYHLNTVIIMQHCGISSFQSLFTKGLSQRIRHLRHNLKRKSGETFGDTNGRRVRPCFKPSTSQSAEQVTSPEDAKSHLEELKREWAKPEKNRNVKHIKLIIEQTKEYREKLLKEDDTGSIAPVLDAYPCFEDGGFVSIIASSNK